MVPDEGDESEMNALFGGDAGPEEPGEKSWTSLDMSLGLIAMPVGHKFLYRFDFGDDHRFSAKVVAIRPAERKVKYPRVVNEVGEAPPQYPDIW